MMNDIGLSELIEQIKQELSTVPTDDLRLFAVGSVEVELAFTATRAVNGKIDLKVAAVGSDAGSERVQRITVTLEPLVTVDELRARYQRLHPEATAAISEALTRAEEEA